MCPGIELVDITDISAPGISTPVFVCKGLYDLVQEQGGAKTRWWLMGIVRALQQTLDENPGDIVYFAVLLGDMELELIAEYALEHDGVIIIIDQVTLEEKYDLCFDRTVPGAPHKSKTRGVPTLREEDPSQEDTPL